MVTVEVVATEELGDRSYIAHDGRTAVVIDPQRDIDRVQGLLDARGLRLGAVCETHLHNDYVTGGLALAQAGGVDYVVPAREQVSFQRRAVADGDRIAVGKMTIRVLSTPGHTEGHVAYLVTGVDGPDDPPAVFTGGSLLYGSVGRTDLVDATRTRELARAQYRSVRRLADMLPADAAVYPTHGFGSFCSSGPAAGGDGSTIARERERNDALAVDDEDAFVDALVAGLTPYPRYYAHMGARNAAGPDAPDLSPAEPVDPAELRKRVANGEWVVDLRSRRLFAASHVAGSVGIALGPHFATYLGWLFPWGTPLTLIADTPEQIADAQRQLVRIGIDRPAGASTDPVERLAGPTRPRSYPVASFADLAAERDHGHQHAILDVRRDDERAQGAIPGSAHIPLHALLDRLGELPSGQLWVHCAAGYRASIAASLLDRAGRDVVLLDDEYSTAVELGLATG